MRTYLPNSPEAAARIVALVLISDGHVCRSEYVTLSQHDGVRALGLDPERLPGIVQALCEDLLMEGFDGRSIRSHMGDGLLASLMAEVDQPQLQDQVLRVAASVVHADLHLAEGETSLLEALHHHWNIHPIHPIHPATVSGTADAGLTQPLLDRAGRF